MGAKTSMLVFSDGNARELLAKNPTLNEAASTGLVQKLFPNYRLLRIKDGTLGVTYPPSDEIYVGSFGVIAVVAAEDFAPDYPSRLEEEFLAPGKDQTVYLHAMHSAVDWFAFAVWKNGMLQRSLSLSPRSGLLEDLGERLPFEVPFWAGEHPAIAPEDEDPNKPYPFKFHPLELGGAALREFFGYQLEGFVDKSLLEPESIPLMRFKRSKRSFFDKLLGR